MKILLATDGSAVAEHATRFLRNLPHLETHQVTLINCFAIPMNPIDETSIDWIADLRDCAMRRQAIQESTIEAFKDTQVQLKFVTREGHAGWEIVDYAKKNRFDLIVLGATGHSLLSRILLGSVSDYVATHADCSVFIVRPMKKTEEMPMLNVTIAYDGSPQSKVAIDEMSRVSWGAKIEVHLVYCARSLHEYRGRLRPQLESDARLGQATAIEQLKLVARQLPFSNPDPKVHVFEADHLGQSIIEFASRAGSDIIMMGDTGQSSIDQMLLGSTSRFVLRHAPTSVWIARRPTTAAK